MTSLPIASAALSRSSSCLTASLLQRHTRLRSRLTRQTSNKSASSSSRRRKGGSRDASYLCTQRVRTVSYTGNGDGEAASQGGEDGEQEVAALKTAVLKQLSTIIDPDFGMDIVSCGFVKGLEVGAEQGTVSFALELTTPACPIKDEFERQAYERVEELEWVKNVQVTMTAQPPKALAAAQTPPALAGVRHIIAVASCKGGVGKSSVAVNLAYTLAQMGAKVGIFDADIHGPSLPTMISPETRVLYSDKETNWIQPVEYESVKAVSFGYAGQGAAIMRGPMVSGVVNQLLTTTEWGELDYLVLDFPPGTGDIQLTICQAVPITAAVIVTTPQKLAYVDVAKGVRMFAKMRVPCVSVVENMAYIDSPDGTRMYPFGGEDGKLPAQLQADFGLPHLFKLAIDPQLASAGDSGRPLVCSAPTSSTAKGFSEIAANTVREVARLSREMKSAVRYDRLRRVIVVKLPSADGSGEEFYLNPALVRRNDRSAAAVDEWTGEQILKPETIPEDIEPESIVPLGNYAAQITWPDGFNQVAPFEILESLERIVELPDPDPSRIEDASTSGEGMSSAQKILMDAQKLSQ